MRSFGTTSWKDKQPDTRENELSKCDGGNRRGQVTVVGIGPGGLSDRTPRASQAILEADLVVGYDTYLELISDLLPGKEILSTGMMREVDRCQAAVDHALSGQKVAVISSGDPGIYGMAGLVLELAQKLPINDRPRVDIIPGISAVGASAAVLGAPLMHDFAVISLSDLMTPWEVIVKRLEAASAADFVIALYNPKSTKRVTHIEEARKIALAHRSPCTPVGIVNQATRPGETAIISTLGDFTNQPIDMFSLVIIGNSQTYIKDGKMVTPRGYQL